MSKFPWGGLIGFVVIVVFIFTLIQIGGAGLAEAGTQIVNQPNETITANFSAPVAVSVSGDRYTQGFEDNETLWNSSGSELTEGTDYDWNTSSGEVSFENTDSVSTSEQINISYAYSQNLKEVRQAEPIVQTIIGSFPLLVWIPFIFFIGGLFVWGWTKIDTARKGTRSFGGR